MYSTLHFFIKEMGFKSNILGINRVYFLDSVTRLDVLWVSPSLLVSLLESCSSAML